MLFYIPYYIILLLVCIGLSHVTSCCMYCSHCHCVCPYSAVFCVATVTSCLFIPATVYCTVLCATCHRVALCGSAATTVNASVNMLYSGSCCKVSDTVYATVLCAVQLLHIEQLLSFCMPVFCVAATCCTVAHVIQ